MRIIKIRAKIDFLHHPSELLNNLIQTMLVGLSREKRHLTCRSSSKTKPPNAHHRALLYKN